MARSQKNYSFGLIFFIGVSGGCAQSPVEDVGQSEDNDIENLITITSAQKFFPSTMYIDAGDTVVWINDGFVLHDLHFQGNPTESSETNLHRYAKKFGKLAIKFSRPGRYPYQCNWHGMFGEIIVSAVE